MIVVLVEGPGDKLALPVLVCREGGRTSIRCIDMRGKSNIVRRDHGFEDVVRRLYFLGERSFLVLTDGDVTFPPYRSVEEEMNDMTRRANALGQELGVPVRACWSILEMESWLIGGIQPRSTYCGLRRVRRAPANTETEPREPKAWLRSCLRDHYYAPDTQECLARHIDLPQAKKRNHSMQAFLDGIR